MTTGVSRVGPQIVIECAGGRYLLPSHMENDKAHDRPAADKNHCSGFPGSASQVCFVPWAGTPTQYTRLGFADLVGQEYSRSNTRSLVQVRGNSEETPLTSACF